MWLNLEYGRSGRKMKRTKLEIGKVSNFALFPLKFPLLSSPPLFHFKQNLERTTGKLSKRNPEAI
jgi:hypothetical protein